LGFPFNIFATTKDSNFKIGSQVVFAKAHHYIPPRIKSGRGHGLGKLPKILGFPLIFLQQLKLTTSKLAGWWVLPKPIIKSHPKEKEGVALG